MRSPSCEGPLDPAERDVAGRGGGAEDAGSCSPRRRWPRPPSVYPWDGKGREGTGRDRGIGLGEGAFGGGRRRRVCDPSCPAAGRSGWRAGPGGAGARSGCGRCGARSSCSGPARPCRAAAAPALRVLPAPCSEARCEVRVREQHSAEFPVGFIPVLRWVPSCSCLRPGFLLRGEFGCQVVGSLGALNSSPAARNGSAGPGKMPAVSTSPLGIC